MSMKNIDVRVLVCESGLTYKDIAAELGITPEWLSRLMRYTLTFENKKLITEAVQRMKARKGIRREQFDVVECVESGDGFVEGCVYSSVGTNNGIQIQRENEDGDCVTYVFQTGGKGKGAINSFDDSGKPSFVYKEWRVI